jgi:ribose 5-phosphate isomerase A
VRYAAARAAIRPGGLTAALVPPLRAALGAADSAGSTSWRVACKHTSPPEAVRPSRCNAPAVTDEQWAARDAAARAAVELVESGMTVGLGSGRAVWRVVELLGARGGEVLVTAASERTHALARQAGLHLVDLDGELELDIALDGADEVDPALRLIKGGGGALLREKIVIAAARRFVVVAEESKRVRRLGERFPLPVEVVRFAWRDTRRRLGSLLPGVELRREEGGQPYLTDEAHHLLDCALPEDVDPEALDIELRRVPGVVEHGLFLGVAERALLGRPDGRVDVLEAS